jgi:hypothetical protein
MQQHIHTADPQHSVVEIEAVEQVVMEVIAEPVIMQEVGIALAQVLAGRDEKAGGAAGGVTD